MRKNHKKVITNCPLKKTAGDIVRTECPAIKNVRNIRKELSAIERAGNAGEEALDQMRHKLKNAKTEGVKEKFCAGCFHKKKVV